MSPGGRHARFVPSLASARIGAQDNRVGGGSRRDGGVDVRPLLTLFPRRPIPAPTPRGVADGNVCADNLRFLLVSDGQRQCRDASQHRSNDRRDDKRLSQHVKRPDDDICGDLPGVCGDV